MTKMRWFWFELNGRYLGKCQATFAQVRAAFPYAEIQPSGLVLIYGRPA